MQIIPRDDDQFELRTRDGSLTLGQSVTIGDFLIPGPGEYEASGIMAEASQAGTRIALEDLTIGHLNQQTKKLTDEDLEQVGSVDILFFPLGGEGLNAKEATALIGQVEASFMIPQVNDQEELAAFCKTVPSCEEVTGAMKVTRTQLPTEGSRILVFQKGTSA